MDCCPLFFAFRVFIFKADCICYFFVFIQGVLEVSPVTGRLEPYYPQWKRHVFRWFVSVPIICLCLAIVFFVMIVILQLQVKSKEFTFR